MSGLDVELTRALKKRAWGSNAHVESTNMEFHPRELKRCMWRGEFKQNACVLRSCSKNPRECQTHLKCMRMFNASVTSSLMLGATTSSAMHSGCKVPVLRGRLLLGMGRSEYVLCQLCFFASCSRDPRQIQKKGSIYRFHQARATE